MDAASPAPVVSTPRPRLAREWPLACLVLLVLVIYGSRLDALTIRGEESRRATVAMEMIATGDWIVPRQQGETKFMSSRPPIHNWLIACAALVRGQLDAGAVRWPSVLAVLVTVVFLYSYARSVMSPLGATTVAAAYATFGQILELGRLGETDAVFTLLLSSAMLTWHWGFTQGWPAWKTWTLAYALAALATLTKGPQAPVYFAASIGMYLLIMRQWRFAFSWQHLAGVGLYAAIFSTWFVPFAASVGWDGVRHTFAGDVKLYLSDWSPKSVFWHYTTFPLSILLGSLLPWSLLLPAWMWRGFRERLGPLAAYALFAATVLLVCLPTVWFIPGARSRFVVSLFPCFAVLAGIVVDVCARAETPAEIRRLWQIYLGAMAGLIGLTAIVLPVMKLVGPSSFADGQPWAFVAFAAVAAVGLATACWQARTANDEVRPVGAVLAVAAFAGLALVGVFANHLQSRSERMDLAMQEFEAGLPADAQMVSLKPVFHLFPYYYGKIIPVVYDPADPQLASAEYFCFNGQASAGPPFAPGRPYEIVTEFHCDREVGKTSHRVTIGRFLPITAARNAASNVNLEGVQRR